MRLKMLLPILTALVLIAYAAFNGAPAADDTPLASSDPPCGYVGPPGDAPARVQHSISYALLESILEKERSRILYPGGETFVGAGDLTVFLTVLTPDDMGGMKIDHVGRQAEFTYLHGVDGLKIDKYGIISIPWVNVAEHGLPELPADRTRVTVMCSERA